MTSLASLRMLTELKVRVAPPKDGKDLLKVGVPGAEDTAPILERPVAGVLGPMERPRRKDGVAGADISVAGVPGAAAPPAAEASASWATINGRIACKVGAESPERRKKPLTVTSGDCEASSCLRDST